MSDASDPLRWCPPWWGVPGGGLPGGPAPGASLTGPVVASERAVIGDELRQPALWCDFSPCLARFTDPAALGDGDLRARAYAAGWRNDALGRLACPDSQQHDPSFWATRQVRVWTPATIAAHVPGPPRVAELGPTGPAGADPRAGHMVVWPTVAAAPGPGEPRSIPPEASEPGSSVWGTSDPAGDALRADRELVAAGYPEIPAKPVRVGRHRR
jgi:hypothetical protein